MAALTIARIANVNDSVWGNKRVRTRLVTGPTSYTTAGEAVTPAQFNLQRIDGTVGNFILRKTADNTDAVMGSYIRATGKIAFYWANAGSASALLEVASTTDLTGYAGEVTVFGTGSA